MRLPRRLLPVLCLLAPALASASPFRVCLQEIPSRISPQDAMVTYSLFILRQLHEPLFSYEMNGHSSNILRSWEADRDYRRFTLCLRDDVIFSNGRPLTLAELERNLDRFSRLKYYRTPLKHIQRGSAGCLVLTFDGPYSDFVPDFEDYSRSIIDTTTESSSVVVGISPYRVARFEPGKAVQLGVADHVKARPIVDSILIERFHDGIDLRDFDELNFLPPDAVPRSVTHRMRKFKTFTIKGYYMLINTPRKAVRRAVFNCIDRETLQRTMFPEYPAFSVLQSPLPVGVTFPLDAPVAQRCTAAKLPARTALEFITFIEDKDRVRDIERALNSMLGRGNVSVQARGMPANDLVNILTSPGKAYDATVIGFGGRTILPYLKAFALGSAEERFLEPRPLLQEFRLADFAGDKAAADFRALVNRLFRRLLEEHYLLPIAQVHKDYYYPTRWHIPAYHGNFDIDSYRIKDLQER